LKQSKTKQEIARLSTRLKTTNKEMARLKVEKVKQQELLEKLLISAYMTGQHDLIKLLLNQDDLSQVIRAKSYYYYLNKARLDGIESLKTTELSLQKNKAIEEASIARLSSLYSIQKIASKALAKQSSKRKRALKKLKNDINYKENKIAELSRAASAMKKILKKEKADQARQALIAAQDKVREDKARENIEKHSRFSTQKRKLMWPIKGKILASFGNKYGGSVRWKGITIRANEGEKVRAVATGKVLFAGYFKGYGMVIALDHGDDYITLYAYNQTLLQKTGDIVFLGDAIALAGHSGGQDKNSLYFELSHKGKQQNPLKWLKARKR